MALKATIFKVDLQVSDMDRHYYAAHALTIARHPSETDERMMMRVLAFARHASEAMSFGKGLADPDEPDLWEKDPTGAIEQWIEVGLPDERSILKACGRSSVVRIYAYGATAGIWWEQIARKVDRARNLDVLRVPAEVSETLGRLVQRTMQLQCTVDDGVLWIGSGDQMIQVDFVPLRAKAG